MKRSRSFLATLLLVVPLCFLGFSAAWAGLSESPVRLEASKLEASTDTPETGTILNLDVFVSSVLNGQKCMLLAGTTPVPANGMPVGGVVRLIGTHPVSGGYANFQILIPDNPELDGAVVYFSAVTIDSDGSISSVSNRVEAAIIDQEDIPG